MKTTNQKDKHNNERRKHNDNSFFVDNLRNVNSRNIFPLAIMLDMKYKMLEWKSGLYAFILSVLSPLTITCFLLYTFFEWLKKRYSTLRNK